MKKQEVYLHSTSEWDQAQCDLASMTRRHRDALCALRKVRAELRVQRAMRRAAYDAMNHALGESCTRRCWLRRGK